MKKVMTIPVFKLCKSSALHSREQARGLFSAIDFIEIEIEKVCFDFSSIEFISRSFADELIQLKASSTYQNIINFTSLSTEVKEMLDAVENTQSSRMSDRKLPVYQFEKMENLFQYFSHI